MNGKLDEGLWGETRVYVLKVDWKDPFPLHKVNAIVQEWKCPIFIAEVDNTRSDTLAWVVSDRFLDVDEAYQVYWANEARLDAMADRLMRRLRGMT